MRRGRRENEGASVGVGDWSSTGTFLRKPPTGWLHDDRELMTGSCIDYEVHYLGCIEVKQSMRTLQFNVRTQVTKEAILRLAEAAGKVFMGKKRKVAKQINKILGVVDSGCVGDMNLSVSVDALKISNLMGTPILNHSLPSISFASGGDGPTTDFIGYVAKDPVHSRACHVFECPNSSQYVLATIGQAFELRYKMYLKTPRPTAQPVEVNDSWNPTDVWGHADSSVSQNSPPNEDIVTTPPAPATPPPSYDGLQDDASAGIYSDIPDFPPPDVPPPLPKSRSESVYNNLPKFPPDIEQVNQTPSSLEGNVVQRLENPYDTMPPDAQFTDASVYSDPGEITSSSDNRSSTYEETGQYSARLMTIRQTTSSDNSADLIDVTPHPPTHDYSNVGPNGKIDRETTPVPLKPPRPPIPSHKPTVRKQGSSEAAKRSPIPKPKPRSYDMVMVEQRREGVAPSADYDDPDVLGMVKGKTASTRPGMYDDVNEVIGSLNKHSRRGKGNPLLVDVSNGTHSVADNVYDPVDPGLAFESPLSPKFDDTIYNRLPGNDQAGGLNDMVGLSAALPDPMAPLPRQQYFHGAISRIEAEALLMSDGEFLVRESTKKAGQYVLTGMASGRIQHLLLMDKHGRVKSKDREFESIPDLVRYFREKQSALIIGTSQVFLKIPIVNAFQS